MAQSSNTSVSESVNPLSRTHFPTDHKAHRLVGDVKLPTMTPYVAPRVAPYSAPYVPPQVAPYIAPYVPPQVAPYVAPYVPPQVAPYVAPYVPPSNASAVRFEAPIPPVNPLSGTHFPTGHMAHAVVGHGKLPTMAPYVPPSTVPTIPKSFSFSPDSARITAPIPIVTVSPSPAK
jgi:hypothetical protein